MHGYKLMSYVHLGCDFSFQILMVVLDPRVRSVFPTVLMFQRQEMGIHVPAKVPSLEYQGWMAVVVV